MKNITLLFVLLIVSLNLLAQGTFTIASGTSITSSGNAYIVLDSSHLQNNGSLQMATGDGTLKFTGAIDVNLSGSGTTALDRLLLAKAASSNLILQTNTAVATEVKFTGGLLNLGSSLIDLGSTGVLVNESEGSRAFTAGTGYIQVNASLNAPTSVNPGNLGAFITTSQNMGNTTIKRGNRAQLVAAGSNSILRYFDITPTNNASLNATLRFHYFDSELNNLNEATLALWKSADQVSWNQVGSNTKNSTANYVEKTDINDFSRWTLAQESLTTYYQDLDEDGYGNATVTRQASELPAGYTGVSGDCKDDNATIHPGAIEICNGVDDDCDGSVDEGFDQDGDGYTTCAGDCNDNNFNVKPSAVEICGDNIDNNCNGLTDEACGQCANATGLMTTNITTTSAKLNWSANVSAVQWRVQYKPNTPGGKWTESLVAGNLRSLSITGLRAKQEYSWRIQAKCGTKWTSYSSMATFKTLATSVTATYPDELTVREEAAQEGLQVRALPNPSTTYFTLQIRSSSDKAVSLRMVDAVGRVVEGKGGIAANSTVLVGQQYRPGVYFAQVMQGGKMVTLKLIKQAY
jgi:hypothetical protein